MNPHILVAHVVDDRGVTCNYEVRCYDNIEDAMARLSQLIERARNDMRMSKYGAGRCFQYNILASILECDGTSVGYFNIMVSI